MTQSPSLRHVLAILSLSCAAAGQWTEPNPVIKPPDRGGAAMTFDWARGNTVMFGGANATAVGALTDTWTYDGTNWTSRNPATSPPGVGRTEMVYDHLRGVSVLFGGAGGGVGPASSDETWEWNGTTWTKAMPANKPSARRSHAMAYDLIRKRVVLYGGIAGGLAATADTWEYDGLNWTQVPASGPGPRAGAAMCFHVALGKTVLFGGVDPFTGGFADTWTWDGAKWTKLNIAGAVPPMREEASMVYDFSRRVAVMFGGLDGTHVGGIRQDTWEFDGTRWTLIADSIATPRAFVGLAMDQNRERVVMFGGTTNSSGSNTSDETSELGGYFRTIGVGCQGSRGVPVLSSPTIPRLGAPLTFALRNLQPATASGLLFLGASDTSWAGIPLPLPLSFLGLTGCSAFVSWDANLLLTVTPSGTASWTANIPSTPPFFGVELFAQGLSVDFAANPAGFVLSNGGGAMIGR